MKVAYHIVSMLNNDVVAISSQENGVAKLYLYSALNLNLPTKPLLLEEFSDIGLGRMNRPDFLRQFVASLSTAFQIQQEADHHCTHVCV